MLPLTCIFLEALLHTAIGHQWSLVRDLGSYSCARIATSKFGKAKFTAFFTANALCKNKADATWGEAAVLLGLDGKARGQYDIFTGEVSFNGTLGARASFTFSTQNGADFGASLMLHGSFAPKIAGGLGVKRLGRLGVYGTGTLEGEGQVLPRDSADWNYLRLRAAIGIELVALRWRPFHKDITYPQWESGETSEESSTDVYGRVLTGGTQMSDEALLAAHADDLTSHDVAFVNGEPVVACAAERGVGDEAVGGLWADVRSADLLVARTDSLERLEVIDLLYDSDQVTPGASVSMFVRVSNEGLATIKEGACAQIIDDTTGTVLGSGSLSQPIGVGAEVDIPVTVEVPSDFDPRSAHNLSVKVNFLGVRAEDSYALNLDTFLVGPGYDPDNASHATALSRYPWCSARRSSSMNHIRNVSHEKMWFRRL